VLVFECGSIGTTETQPWNGRQS